MLAKCTMNEGFLRWVLHVVIKGIYMYIILITKTKFEEGVVIPVFSSVQFSRSVVSDSLRPHESQHARPPCPSPTPEVYSNSCPLSR